MALDRAAARKANAGVGGTAKAWRGNAKSEASAGGGRASGSPSPTATRAAAFGDLHTATELAAALAALGHEVELLEVAGERWRESVDAVDVFVSLHDRLDLGEVPDRVVTAAWVRNWTDRWIGRPWFRGYDTVFASSQASAELIAERTGIEAGLLPLATNPERFRPLPAAPELRADLMFAGNHWGRERIVADVLPRVAESFDVRVYGKGWEDVPGMGPLSAGPLPYEKLPLAYSSSALVVDDSAPHTRRFGAVNSRVFDALACGVPVDLERRGWNSRDLRREILGLARCRLTRSARPRGEGRSRPCSSCRPRSPCRGAGRPHLRTPRPAALQRAGSGLGSA